MAIDKFNKPLLSIPKNRVERKAHEDAEEIISDRATAEKTLAQIREALQKAGETLPKDAKLLELGTGTGEFLKYLLEEGYNVVGVDARPRHTTELPIREARIEQLPFADGQFDVLISSGVFDRDFYKQYRQPMLNEMQRVLKPGGLYIAVIDLFGRKIRGMSRIAEPTRKGISLYRNL